MRQHHEVGGRYDETDDAAEGPKDYISDVRESSLWASLRDCLTPANVVVLRTAGPKWYNAKLYGPELADPLSVLPHEKKRD